MNPYQSVIDLEQRIAEFGGAKYAVATDSCSSAIFLSLMFRNIKDKMVIIPSKTYPSIPCGIIHAGGKVHFSTKKWEGIYELEPFKIIDSALRFKPNMYIKDTLYCLSFHIKKHLPIGRGGMILTDNIDARDWLRKARFDGRNPVPLQGDNFDMLGYNCYLTPEQGARGIQLFEVIKNKELPDLKVEDQKYADLIKFPIYQ